MKIGVPLILAEDANIRKNTASFSLQDIAAKRATPMQVVDFLFSLTEVGGNLDSQEGGIPSEFSPIIEIAAGNVFEPTTSTRRQARHATTCQNLALTQLTQVSH